MRRNLHPVLWLCLLLVLMLSLGSCYTEQSLGRRFVKGTLQEKPSIWFIGANYLFKTCSMEDDTLIAPCVFTAAASDSVMLEDYNSQFAKQLESYGYRVFAFSESDSFFKQPGLKLIVNIAQLELEEYIGYADDTETFDDTEYLENIPVRVVSLNAWLEVSVVDSNSAKQDLFFTTDSMADIVDGYFMQHQITGNVTYYFKRYSMRPSMLPRLTQTSGKQHAARLFDVWMNRYILKNDPVGASLESQYTTRYYYHYDPEKNRIIISDPAKGLKKL